MVPSIRRGWLSGVGAECESVCGWEGGLFAWFAVWERSSWWCGGHAQRPSPCETKDFVTGLVVGLVHPLRTTLQLYTVQLQTYGLRFYSSLSCASAYVTVLTLGPDLYFSKFD